MAKGKLILICQSGGEFLKDDDGSLKYAGGEAQAVNVNCETLFDALKLKLAEMCNLEYETVSIKYFLPGNTRTLITLSNDKDLKRMLDFHGNSVIADVFVMGTEGFNGDTLNIFTNRETGIKVAESVNCVVAPKAAVTTSPVDASGPVGTSAACVATRRTKARKKATPAFTDSETGVDATERRRPTKATTTSNTPHDDSDNSSAPLYSPANVAAKSNDHNLIEVDMGTTPADTVKKRRRIASWKVGVNGSTIVAVPDDDDAGDKRPRKKNSRSLVADDDMRQEGEEVAGEDDFGTPLLPNSDDVSLEELIASWKDGITGIDQDFKNVYEFRDALQKYSIAHCFVYRLKNNDSNHASGVCVVEGCSWRIHASWVPAAASFRIKKFNNSHTCAGESWKSAHPTKNWLVNIIKDKLRDFPYQKPKDIANGILRDFGIELNYTHVRRGIVDAREPLQGSYKEAYNQLSWYCEKIMETNPGSFVKLAIGDDKRFQCFFLSFHASIHGFQEGCRPLLFLESTSLKSRCHEVLLTATALDADDGFFPVAFAIVDVENDDNWHWFLEHLKSALPVSGSVTFVSDREKGLKELVFKVFENACLGYSMYHLLESFKKSLKGPFHGDGKGSLPGNFVAAAHAVRLLGFKKYTEQIKLVSSDAYNWVMQIEPEYWTSTSFKGERHNQITQNVAELYIKLMEEVRESPITQKIETLIRMITELINTRRMDSSMWSMKLTPSKKEKLHEEIVDARGLKVLMSSDALFEVHNDANHVVNLNKWECTCLGWQTTGLPCHHTIAVLNHTCRSLYDYCSKYFTVDSFHLTYSESISPVAAVVEPAEEETASDIVHMLPPCPSSRSRSQPKAKEANMPEQTTRVDSCTNSKEAGHNKDSCEAKEANVLELTTTVDSCTKSKEAGHNKDSCEAKEANVLELTTMVDSCTNSKEAGHNKDSCEAKEANVLEPMTMVDSCTNSKEAGHNKDSCEAKEANVLEPTTMVDSCTNSKEAGHNKDSCEAKEANVLEPMTMVDSCTNSKEAGHNKDSCEAKEANVLEPTTMVDSCTNSKEAGHNKDSCEAKEANVPELTTMVDSCTNSKEAGHNKDSCTNCEEAGDNKADCEATL
ncbi:unnamed protein product [Camellia sinensis]